MPTPSAPFTKPPVVPVMKFPNGEYYPPPKHKSKTGHWYMTRVIDGDSWLSLAALDGWTDVWGLIEANFQTRDPDVVNWYLKEYVGCVDMTPDHHNYRFSKKAKPGVIYTQTIINRTGDETEFQKLFNLVQGVLHDAKVKYVNFELDGRAVTPGLLHQVGGCLSKGWVKLRYSPKLDADGEYFAGDDTLKLKSLSSAPEARALILHEAVHAGLDWKHISGLSITKAHSEALAYVAQAAFFHHSTGLWLSGDADEAGIFDAVDVVVEDMVDAQLKAEYHRKPVERYVVPKARADDVIDAVNASPRYAGSKSQWAKYDGIYGPSGG